MSLKMPALVLASMACVLVLAHGAAQGVEAPEVAVSEVRAVEVREGIWRVKARIRSDAEEVRKRVVLTSWFARGPGGAGDEVLARNVTYITLPPGRELAVATMWHGEALERKAEGRRLVLRVDLCENPARGEPWNEDCSGPGGAEVAAGEGFPAPRTAR